MVQHNDLILPSLLSRFLKQQKPQNEKSLNQNFRSSFDGLIKSVVEEKAFTVLFNEYQNYTNSLKGSRYLFANKSLYSWIFTLVILFFFFIAILF